MVRSHGGVLFCFSGTDVNVGYRGFPQGSLHPFSFSPVTSYAGPPRAFIPPKPRVFGVSFSGVLADSPRFLVF